MAEPLDLSAFDKAVPLNSFDRPAAPKAVALDQFDDPGVPVGQMTAAPQVPIEDQVVQAVSNAIPESVKGAASELGQYVMKSPVGTALEYLNKPMQAVSAGIVEAGSLIDPNIKKELNPNSEFFPEIAYHDVINYAAPSNDAVEETLKKYGFSQTLATAGRLGYATAKAGVGLVADIVGDPANLVAAGAIKAGAKGLKAASTLPGAAKATNVSKEVYGRTIGLFDVRTGFKDVDEAAGLASALKRGDNAELYGSFYKPIADLKLSPEENAILAKAVESTPNNADTKAILEAAKKANNANIAEGRLEKIADVGAKIKAANAEDLAERVGAGLIEDADLPKKTIENYLVHKISPDARKWIQKNPELAADIQTKLLGDEVAKTNTGWMNEFDSGKFARNIQKPLAEANAMMKGMTKGAVDEWFISDPAIATMLKRAETRKLVRDKQLIDVMKEHAVDGRDVKRLGLKGYKPIMHEDFIGKNLEINTPNGTKLVPFNEVYFPQKIADKVGYMIQPREVGNFLKFVDGYNQVFRTVALAKADYYLQNFGENFFKNYVVGVKLEDYKDAWKLGSERGSIMVKGKPVPVTSILRDAQRYGIDSGGQFNEGIHSLLFTGKKLVKDGAFKTTAKAPIHLLRGLRHMGEKGENFTRRALFLNRIKKGMSVEDAVLDVEKYLFDFSRNTRATNAVRRFWNPFAQAAIKTALITPELMVRNPKAYNFLHNNMPNAIAAAFNDPMTQAEVIAVMPQYKQYQDPIVGPLLTGNDWLYKVFTNKDTPQHLGGKTATIFRAPIGLDILNQFAVWDGQTWKNSGPAAPMVRSALMMIAGKDLFTGKDLDLVRGEPDMARRFNAAMANAAQGLAPLPNTWQFIKDKLGMTDPQYVTPLTLKMLNANLGKFVTFTNLDKEFFFKLKVMERSMKELSRELGYLGAQEQRGQTVSMSVAGIVGANDIHKLVNRPMTTAYIYSQLQEKRRVAFLTMLAGAGLRNELRAAEIVGQMRDISKQIDQLNHNYATVSEYRLMVLKEAREQGDTELEKEIVPEANRAPQSISNDEIDSSFYRGQNIPRGKTDEDERAIRDRIQQLEMEDRNPNSPASQEEFLRNQEAEREKEAKWANAKSRGGK